MVEVTEEHESVSRLSSGSCRGRARFGTSAGNSMRLVRGARPSKEVRLPPGYDLDHSDPDVLILRSPHGTAVARFSARGATAEAIEREAKMHYRARTRPAWVRGLQAPARPVESFSLPQSAPYPRRHWLDRAKSLSGPYRRTCDSERRRRPPRRRGRGNP